jgi:HAE1 family hydrophobic/amphiphilic exporter-1
MSVQQDVIKKLGAYRMPEGYTYTFAGSVEQMTDSVTSLLLVLLVAFAMVYMVMVAQFQKYLNPFIIMFSIPVSLSGGLFGLFITGHHVDVSALMGLIMLVGMAVKNAIMLIDYTEQLRSDGLSCREALIEAGATRIRPILMTTLTTILGLLPMAVTSSSGTEMTKPMAIVTNFGMAFSLFVTLIFIPVLYTYLDDRRQKRAQNKRKKEEALIQPAQV